MNSPFSSVLIILRTVSLSLVTEQVCVAPLCVSVCLCLLNMCCNCWGRLAATGAAVVQPLTRPTPRSSEKKPSGAALFALMNVLSPAVYHQRRI